MKPRPARYGAKSEDELQEIIGRLIQVSKDGPEGLVVELVSSFRLNFRSKKERNAARRRLMKFIGKGVCVMTSSNPRVS